MVLFMALCVISAKAQFVNMDFENWSQLSDSVYRPDSWLINQGLGQFGIYRDSLPQNGNFAMTLSRWYYYTFDDAVQTAATATKPITLQGFFRYTNNDILLGNNAVKDTAHVYVYVKKWNSATQQNDTIGRGHTKLLEATYWTPFSCPIYYTSSQVPDSITIRLAPTENNINTGSGLCNTSGSGWCSYFTVDNLNLSETVGIDNINIPEFKLYPNPAIDKLFIASSAQNTIIRYTIIDATGKIVASDTSYNPGKAIDVSALSNGLYILHVYSNGKTLSQKIIKQ